MEELGQTMSSEEFSEFQVLMGAEQMLPIHDRQRHGDVLAAQFNGPLQRAKGRGLWTRHDALDAVGGSTDPWPRIAAGAGAGKGAKAKKKPKASAQDVLAGVNQLRKKRGA